MSRRWFLIICAMAVVVAAIGEPKPWNLWVAGLSVIVALHAYLSGDEVGP